MAETGAAVATPMVATPSDHDDGHDGDMAGDRYDDDDDGQERARAGRASGTFLPLNAILRKTPQAPEWHRIL